MHLCVFAEKHAYKNFQKAFYARMMPNNIVSQVKVNSFFPQIKSFYFSNTDCELYVAYNNIAVILLF